MRKQSRNEHYHFHVDKKDFSRLISMADDVIDGPDLHRPAEKLINRYQFCTLLVQALNMMTSLDMITQNYTSRGMGDMIRYINSHVTEPLTLDDLASSFHVSKYYLLREFKKYTGISVHQYLIIRRIFVSQEMIRRGTKPKEACFQCGFTDYSSFYRAFKAKVGMSPEQYRQCMQS